MDVATGGERAVLRLSGELDLASMLRDLEESGFEGPVSMEIEYMNYEYPEWEACVEGARRGKAYWDSIRPPSPV